MTQINNNKRLDNPNGSVEIQPNNAMNANEQSKKTPWHLRFAGAILAVAGILLALPGGEVQAQCEDQIPCYDNTEFGDATSKADCDRILQEVLAKIEQTNEKINDAWEAAKKCDKDYDESLKTNNLNYNRTLAEDRATVKSIFLTCMGLGVGGASAGTAVTSVKKVTWTIRGGLTVVVRLGSAAIGTVVTIGATAYCISLRNSTAESLRETRDAIKEDADARALRARDTCRRTTNYARVKRRYDNWKGGRYPSGKGYRYNPGNYRRAINSANADHAKCLAHFTYGDCGDCGTTE